MGYWKQKQIDDNDLEHFIDVAKAGMLHEEWPNLTCYSSERLLTIDTDGNTEVTSGAVYPFNDDVQVFVPDECWAMTQPIVERHDEMADALVMDGPSVASATVIPFKPKPTPTVGRSDTTDNDVGYHGLQLSDL